MASCLALISGPSVDDVVESVPSVNSLIRLTSFVGELLAHRVGDVEPVGGGAGLAAVAHLGQHRAVDGGVDVGVVEHDERRVAAEFHRRAQQRSAACCARAACRRRSSR